MNGRPPQLSPPAPGRALAAVGPYLVLREATGSATGALAITEAVPATWLLAVGVVRRRLDPVAVVSTVTVAIALAAYALTGGDLALRILTAIIGLTFAIDGASQIALALTVPTAMFVPDSTAARIVVLGIGAIGTVWYTRHQKQQRDAAHRPPARFEGGA